MIWVAGLEPQVHNLFSSGRVETLAREKAEIAIEEIEQRAALKRLPATPPEEDVFIGEFLVKCPRLREPHPPEGFERKGAPLLPFQRAPMVEWVRFKIDFEGDGDVFECLPSTWSATVQGAVDESVLIFETRLDNQTKSHKHEWDTFLRNTQSYLDLLSMEIDKVNVQVKRQLTDLIRRKRSTIRVDM